MGIKWVKGSERGEQEVEGDMEGKEVSMGEREREEERNCEDMQ